MPPSTSGSLQALTSLHDISLACASLCLEIQTIHPDTLQPPTFLTDSIHPENDLVTWLVEGGRFLVLIQTLSGTRVYDAQDDYLYYATPHAQLAPACPPGHAFLCQTVQDSPSVVRLLVTDLVFPRIDCPRLRGETLRALAPVLPPICHIQWAGKRSALERFISGGGVPHRVAALVALRGPLTLVREPCAITGIGALDALLLTQ
jgi:hypothetical protein